MTYTDTQLKQALANMLPGEIEMCGSTLHHKAMSEGCESKVYDTELLHLCWLVEKSLTLTMSRTSVPEFVCTNEASRYFRYLIKECGDLNPVHATWQQRVISLAKVKGFEL